MDNEKLYDSNKTAKVGEEIVCPICGKKFVKKQYNQVFDCGECKDKYWNGKGKDRHKKGYYRRYNKLHAERLERGYTKGYRNGNASEGMIGAQGVGYLGGKMYDACADENFNGGLY